MGGRGELTRLKYKPPVVLNTGVPRLIDHPAARALAYRTRAIELATQAKREDDPSQRRFLVDKARALVNVADALDPQPPAEPGIFSNSK
jgi:hypothetical protein